MASDTPEQARAKERKRLGTLLAASAAIFRIRFERFVEVAQSPEVAQAITEALEQGNVTGAVSIVRAQVGTMRPAVAEAFIDAGREAADEVVTRQAGTVARAAAEAAADEAAAVEAGGAGGAGGGAAATGTGEGGGLVARVGIVFDPTNPVAAELMRRESDLFLKEMTDAQVEATREAIAAAFDRGIGPRATAKVIQQSIGLTAYQQQIVQNYADSLQSGSTRALNYQLRNRAKDAAVERAAAPGGRAMPQATIDRMVDQYRKNFLRYRAETIARTESTRVTSIAREESFRQLAAKLRIGHNRIIRVWNATEDDRTREWHASMDGQEATVGQQFTDGLGNALRYPGDRNAPLASTANCRCTLTMRIADDA